MSEAAERPSNVDPSRLGPDITACDREPIHVPGSIQPHGMILVAEPGQLRIIAGAGDIETRLATHWLGRPLSEVLRSEASGQLDTAALSQLADGGTFALGPLRRPDETFDVVAHRSGDRVILEFEPAAEVVASATSVLSAMDVASTTFERASDVRELCRRAAILFREMTGFDRVMVYQFLDDDAGVVVAEDRDPALGSFLNHHFPASDIPKQARALYIRNRVRVIPDIAYAPAPLRHGDVEIGELDMSDVGLRSVSPIHLQYLKNMGVAASASISIVKDGILWGLIACHHGSPKGLTYDSRLACRGLAGGLGRQIRAKEEAETYRERIRLRAAEDAVMARLGNDGSLHDLFASTGDDLRRMLGADGFAALQGRELFTAGRCPGREAIREMALWVRDRATGQPFSTHALSQRFEAARAYRNRASGLLAVTMSTEEPTLLMWFRAEKIQLVNWAGNPHKAVSAEPGAMLSPRASFASWSEDVHGRSPPWTLGEVEAANRLRLTMFEARQNRRIRDLNRELTLTVADKENLLTQKDYLLKEVNHRVQNSLQLVSAFLSLQARAVGDAALSDHLGEAQRRLSAVALVHRRLYNDDQVETVDLARYLEDLCTDMRSSMGDEWSEKFGLDLAPILISADRAVNVGLIMTELVINANKYAYGGAPGPISINLEQHRNRFRLIVADQGAGKSKEPRATIRQGFGTRMLNAMVDSLSGIIEDDMSEPGLRVIVTAPIEAAA